MGCSSSAQTLARERSRPNAKPEETNGAGVVDTHSENRSIAEDAETIPDAAHLCADQVPGEGSLDQGAAGEKPAEAVEDPTQQECCEPHPLEQEASDVVQDEGRVTSAPAESPEDHGREAESIPNEHGDAMTPGHENAQAPSENE